MADAKEPSDRSCKRCNPAPAPVHALRFICTPNIGGEVNKKSWNATDESVLSGHSSLQVIVWSEPGTLYESVSCSLSGRDVTLRKMVRFVEVATEMARTRMSWYSCRQRKYFQDEFHWQ
jgi:hypothetical protein